ncbi:ATP-binding cassette domain-containing protein [Microbacterium rhizophilus]|uniref:ATP-binding cassette domain-containing protein n=1 Tax=Microbacterium rhizophilus TaxID=3138934 RepID=UPI0031EFAC3E
MTTSPLDDDAGATSSGGGAAAAPGGPAQRPAAKRPAGKRPARRPASPRPAAKQEQDDAHAPAAAQPRKPASPRKPAAKRPATPAKPRSGTKTSAARNATGRSAVAQPAALDSATEAEGPATLVAVLEPPAPTDEAVQDAPPAAEEDTVQDAPPAAEEDVPADEPSTEVVEPAAEEDAPADELSTEVAEPAADDPPTVDEAPAPVVDEAPAPAVADPEPEADENATAILDVEEERGADPAPEGATAPRPDAAPALVLRGVSRSYGGTTAVAGIDLTVPAGSFYGLVGPNGAGKTTTMSMIAGLLRPDRGEITVAGIDMAKKPRAAKALMGVLPDRLRTFDRLTGRQLLYYFGVLRGLKPDVVARRTADLARAFDLTDALGRVVSDYSAGMTKKVMLAGAMIHSPRLLVLDEPFEAVDPVSSANILEILSAYVAHGGTVLLSSHGMDLIERVCTRVAVIVAGQLLAEGTVAEVRGELTLEQRFVELSGEVSSMEGLEWLHTFSD